MIIEWLCDDNIDTPIIDPSTTGLGWALWCRRATSRRDIWGSMPKPTGGYGAKFWAMYFTLLNISFSIHPFLGYSIQEDLFSKMGWFSPWVHPVVNCYFLVFSDLRCYGTSQKLKVEPCRRWSCLFSRLKTHMEPAKIWSEDISRTGDGIGRSCCESILTVIHLATKFTMIYETLETTIL